MLFWFGGLDRTSEDGRFTLAAFSHITPKTEDALA